MDGRSRFGTVRACRAHGVPEKLDRALTLRWTEAIADAMDRDGECDSADRFLAAHLGLRRGKPPDGAAGHA